MNPVKKHSNTLFKPLSEINNVLHMSDGLNIDTEVPDDTWGLILPNKKDKKDIIRLLNDDNLLSESSDVRYQAINKRQV